VAVADRLLTYEQAADRLAVSEITLRRLVAQGALTKVKIGAAPRVRESDVEAVIVGGVPKVTGWAKAQETVDA
jgi:excisionase family DNA binding protein